MIMKTWTKVLLSIPKTLYVNFRYLPLQQALKLPLLVAYNVDFLAHRGGNNLWRCEIWNDTYWIFQHSSM